MDGLAGVFTPTTDPTGVLEAIMLAIVMATTMVIIVATELGMPLATAMRNEKIYTAIEMVFEPLESLTT
jgi:hypothetical protein